MRRILPAVILGVAGICTAQSNKLAGYPLRVHVFGRNQTTFYHRRITEEAKGEGRANLFENGQPRGMDFQFNCPNRLQTSSGFETFPARWKKPNQELEVLLPEFGKPDKYNKCKFEVRLKDFAYLRTNGALTTEPIDAYKQWMLKHDYDPEQGKNAPTPNPRNGQAANTQQQSQ
jgi:hypothetical protein